MKRRTFLKGMLGSGLLPMASGCRTFIDDGLSRAHCCPYWCTWGTQADTLKNSVMTGDLAFPGDQGVPGVRDNLNETVLFGEKGWAKLFPENRGEMMFLIDDGWDVPYGVKHGRPGIHSFGSHCLDRDRFPSFGVNASDRDRLRGFVRRVEDLGWKGLGVWVACQAHRERFEAPFPMEYLKEDLKRKLDEAAYAGVKYWKVDWGVHNFHVWYRRLMSELKERYYPELIVDHCRGFNNAINGQVDPYLKPDDEFRNVGRMGRILGVAEFDPITREIEEIMEFSDVFRTYDSANPLTTATMLERAVWELLAADKSASRVVINTEDEPLLAAGLGLELSMMRAPVRPEESVPTPRPRNRRMAEDMRCLLWNRLAPPFGSDTAARVRYSEKSIREDWLFKPGQCWFTGQKTVYYHQTAPAVVTRGLPLPEVRGTSAEVPYVVASRHPNGALALSVMPVIDQNKGSYTPKASVTLDAALEVGVPLAVFGHAESVILRDATDGEPIFARDLLGGKTQDISAACRRADGRIVLPGALLAKIGSACNTGADDSQPGVLVTVG